MSTTHEQPKLTPMGAIRRMIVCDRAAVVIDPDFDVPVLQIAWNGGPLVGLYTDAHPMMLRCNVVRAWDGEERMTIDVPFDPDNEDGGSVPFGEALICPQGAALQHWLQTLPDDEARAKVGPVPVPPVDQALQYNAAIKV